MSDHVEKRDDWAAVMREALREVWDGYEPPASPAPAARVDQVPEQAADPGYIAYTAQTLTDLEARRAARRAEIASRATSDQRGA